MRWSRSIPAALAAATLLVVMPAPAAATTTYTAPTAGIEISATSTKGTFAGTSWGDLPGYWKAAVEHTPLGTAASVTGGSFSLTAYLNNSVTSVEGRFVGGTIRQTGGFTGCSNQYYTVNTTLGAVRVGARSGGTGTFGGTLAHYRKLVFGYCLTYSATIRGSVTLVV